MRKLLIGGACASIGAAVTLTPAFALNLGDKPASSTQAVQLVRDGGGGGRGGDGGGGGRGGDGGGGGASAGQGHSSGSGGSLGGRGGSRGGEGPAMRGDGPRGNWSKGDRGNWSKGDRGGRHVHRGYRHRHGGVGIYFDGGYDAGYYNDGYSDCGWLRRKAARTGSSYWWRRYQDCID